MPNEAHHVVIVGAGFGGIETARDLAKAPVRVTLIDRRNFHLFQPLLYQAAGSSLAPSEIAWPIRSLLRGAKNVTTLMGEVAGVDYREKQVRFADGERIGFDTLVLATGAGHAYFGRDDWEPYAPGLKTIEDATKIRGHILLAFEKAEREKERAERAKYLTFVIIGGGPTGVELAGTIAELAKGTLRGDFRNLDVREVRVVLLEAGPRILPGFKEVLSSYAQRALEKLGVEVKLGHPVSDCSDDGVVFDGQKLYAKTILWAAGVEASPAAKWLGAEADRAGRVLVESDLTVPGKPDVFVIGDTASVKDPEGKPVPGVAPAAKQEARYVAGVIKSRLRGGKPAGAFKYKNAGNLATIGKRAAIADFGRIRLTGRLAWWLWSVVHVYFLINLRNRLAVGLSWLWIYFTGQRSARLITRTNEEQENG
ncbi:MAG TPA: NAD(P)/FAD-dependent oxidoreductase [Pseudoxanthomonas sp.]